MNHITVELCYAVVSPNPYKGSLDVLVLVAHYIPTYNRDGYQMFISAAGGI
jgi:hypothetical protein